MAKKQSIPPKALILFVLAAIFLGLGILFLINGLHNFLDLDIDLGKILTGVVIIVVATLVLIPLSKNKNSKYSWIYLAEYALLLIAGIVGFILPGFNRGWGANLGNTSLWFGLIIGFHAMCFLLVNQFAKKLSDPVFVLMLILLFMSGYIIGSNMLEPYVEWAIVSLFFIAAIFLFVKGMHVKNKSHKAIKS